jgi:hypothetical protein
MSIAFYHIAHLVGLILLFVGFGALASGNRKGMMYHGIGLLILLIAGFGLIAKLQIPYASHFVIGKGLIFLILGFLPVLVKKNVLSASAVLWIAIALGGLAAYMGYLKKLPF